MKLALLTGILAAVLGGSLQDEDPAKKIATLVKQLSSDDFQTREEASAELKKIGSAAIPALEEASRSDDPETRMRAESILEALKKKATPTPRKKLLPGARVTVQSRNGDTIYTLTPSEGDPITFHKRRDGSVLLEYVDEEGLGAKAKAGSLKAFLERFPKLAKKYGISEKGINHGGARTSFRNGFSFKFRENFGDLEGDRPDGRFRENGHARVAIRPEKVRHPSEGGGRAGSVGGGRAEAVEQRRAGYPPAERKRSRPARRVLD